MEDRMGEKYRLGARYLTEHSRLRLQLAQSLLLQRRCIMIIEDSASTANAVASYCRLLTGYAGQIVVQKSLGNTLCDWQIAPDVIFLSDQISRVGTGTQALERLSTLKLADRVVMVSPTLSLARRRRLVELGAFDALDYDQLDSFGIASVLLRCFAARLK
jgi:hypothetical protein